MTTTNIDVLWDAYTDAKDELALMASLYVNRSASRAELAKAVDTYRQAREEYLTSARRSLSAGEAS